MHVFPDTPELLMQIAHQTHALCQRQVDKHRLLDNLNLDAIVAGIVREHAESTDYDEHFHACINAMSQDDAVGQTLVFLRDEAKLHMHHIATLDLLEPGTNRYEMVLFDGGNTHGDRWKHVFFPAQLLHFFVYESN